MYNDHCKVCNIRCALAWQGLTCAVQLGRMDMPSIKVASQLINIITITFFIGVIRDMVIAFFIRIIRVIITL